VTNKALVIIQIMFMLIGTAIAEEPNVSDITKNDKKTDSILVDIVKGKISDVSYRESIVEIEKTIGITRIKKLSEVLEGDATDYYEIDINGHKIFKHWYATSFKDPFFKLKSGLGVQSRVRDFKNVYGNGEIIGGEGEVHLCFRSAKPKYFFCINNIEGIYQNPDKFDNWPVKSLRVF